MEESEKENARVASFEKRIAWAALILFAVALSGFLFSPLPEGEGALTALLIAAIAALFVLLKKPIARMAAAEERWWEHSRIAAFFRRLRR